MLMRKRSAQLQNQAPDYGTLRLNYLYLQCVRRNMPMAKLPLKLLNALDCSVEQNGTGLTVVRALEPDDSSRAQRMGRALKRIWMSKKNEDVFAYFPHQGKQKPKKEKEEEAVTQQSDEAEEAMMQAGISKKDVLYLRNAESNAF